MSNTYQLQSLIPEDHPSLNGHFPGNPIVPGVVLLEHVAQALASWRPELVIVEFPVVKFKQTLRADQLFNIHLQQKADYKYSFECICAGQVIASGTFMCKAL